MSKEINNVSLYQWTKYQLMSYINVKANEILNKMWLNMVESFMGEKFESPPNKSQKVLK